MDESNNETNVNKDDSMSGVISGGGAATSAATSESGEKPETTKTAEPSSAEAAASSKTKDDEANKTSNLINLTIKTPKDKDNVSVSPDCTVKDVKLFFCFFLLNKFRMKQYFY